MLRAYNTLMPATGGSAQIPPEPPADPTNKRKRIATRIACNNCRSKKSACDGQRPSCAQCLKSDSACEYISQHERETPSMALKRQINDLRHTSQDLQELITLLTYVPEDMAYDVLKRLRLTADVPAVLESMKGYRLDQGNRVLSEQATARSVLPLVQSTMELELMVRHPMLYPVFDPSLSSLLGSIATPSRIRIQKHGLEDRVSSNYPSTFASSPSSGSSSTLHSRTESIALSSMGLSALKIDQVPPSAARLGPENHTNLCDDRLNNLVIGYWTKVPITDVLAARLISMYLETDHPFWGLFDPDLFVTDLVEHRLRFCSPLLASSLLVRACQMYTAIDTSLMELSYVFRAEAVNLWRAEQNEDSLTTICALNYLSLSASCAGDEYLSQKYCTQGREMAHRMKLFGVPKAKAKAAGPDDSIPSELRLATAYAAWGIYNWLIMQSLYLFEEPVDHPPYLPIPGKGEPTEGHRDATTSDDGAIKPLPSYMGQTFTVMCEYWSIIGEVVLLYRANNSVPLRDRVPFAFAESKYRKLIHWADHHSYSMNYSSESPPHVALFHIWYHSAVLDIFRPFIPLSKQCNLRVYSSSNDNTAETIFSASLKQLKQLVILFQKNHDTASSSCMFWHIALLQVANAVLNDPSDPEWQFYFLLCIRGYQKLFPAYRFAEPLSLGLLTMALRNGIMSSSEAKMLREEFHAVGKHHEQLKRLQSRWTVDLNLAITNSKAAQADTMADRFEELAMFNEITTDGLDDIAMKDTT